MPFSSLSAGQRITVLLELLGGPKYAAQMKLASAETATLGKRTNMMGRQMQLAGRRTTIANQALYTFRRLAFYGTLAILGTAAAVGKLGYSYLSAMQTARVALKPVIKDQSVLNGYLAQLFQISKYSPFVITDLAISFRQLFAGLQGQGVSPSGIIRTIRSLTDLMSFAGKTGPGQLQRTTLALQHMAYAGHLTGYAVNQLSRDGIPIFRILNKELGITGDQFHNISKMGIPASRVLAAINKYAETTKGPQGAALRISLQTLPGLLQVVRDSLSQLSGSFLSGIYGDSGGGKKSTGIQGFIYNLVRRGGPLDKVSSFGANHSGSSTLKYFNKQITGNSGLAQGLLLLLSIGRNVGAVFAKVIVPAWIMGLHALIVFYPILKLVNFALGFLAKHATIAKFIFAALAAEFVITHFALLGLWSATKLYNVATLGAVKPLLKFIKYLKILRTVELAGGIGRLLTWARATEQAGGAGAKFGDRVFVNTGRMAKMVRGIETAIMRLRALKLGLLGIAGLTISAVVLLTLIPHAKKNANPNAPSNNPVQHFFTRIPVLGGLASQLGRAADSIDNALGLTPSDRNNSSRKLTPQTYGRGRASMGKINLAPDNGNASALGTVPTAAGDIVVHSQLIVDRKVLAEAVARANQDKSARR